MITKMILLLAESTQVLLEEHLLSAIYGFAHQQHSFRTASKQNCVTTLKKRRTSATLATTTAMCMPHSECEPTNTMQSVATVVLGIPMVWVWHGP